MSSEEKTESATPRRRQKEKEKGNIAKSQDMNSALLLCAAVAMCLVFSPFMMEKLQNLMRFTFTNLQPQEITESSSIPLIIHYAIELCYALFPFLALLFFVTIFLLLLSCFLGIIIFNKLDDKREREKTKENQRDPFAD